MKILAHLSDDGLRETLAEAAERIGAAVVEPVDAEDAEYGTAVQADVVLAEYTSAADLDRIRSAARAGGAGLLIVCPEDRACRPEDLASADDWTPASVTAGELATRLCTAQQRAAGTARSKTTVAASELVRYQELLYDKLTGFPTLPVMMERAREMLERRGEFTALYIHFVWYEKIEEIYGWQKLDDVLETTADAVREYYAREHAGAENLVMVSHVADDDFILFTQIPQAAERAERRITELSQHLERFLREHIEEVHGEDIATLCGIYVGASTVFRNPKIRTERLIYRGIREAAEAARGAEAWERTQKISDLKATLREGAVFMEYHPIIVTETEQVYGYEALARGLRRGLRSPEVLFEVAEEANLIWELSRLLRKRAVQGIAEELGADKFLFLNIDPHDFDDPVFRNLDPEELGIADPGHIVMEITERTAIKDYPRFQEYLTAFRERGFRFAVDDAGSGYAGLGSIANLAPDYIKLDISLISNIDSNFLKQNLVETMVGFAESHGSKVIAEGVERKEEFETVRELGVHLTQGFYFHKPRYAGRLPT